MYLSGILALGIFFHIFVDIQESLKELNQVQSKSEVDIKGHFMHYFLEEQGSILLPLSESVSRQLASGSPDYDEMAVHFHSIMKHNTRLMQLRYIDASGRERIRMDRLHPDGEVKPAVVLQDKSHRDYFLEAIKLPQGALYHSAIDYNIEHHQVTSDIVMRSATPVVVDGTVRGIVIINTFAQMIMELLAHSEVFDVYLPGPDGEIFFHDHSLRRYPEVWKAFQKGVTYHAKYYHLTQPLLEYPSFWMLLVMKESVIAREMEKVQHYILLVLAALLILFVPVMLILRSSFQAIKASRDEVMQLNHSLMERVEAETSRRVSQERMMIHQSRLAAMGEMIGAIAHQWRQPLNALNLVVYNIKYRFEEGELDQEFFNSQYEKVNNLVQKMSKIIDDFRNFFRPNKVKEVFCVNAMLEDALHLIGETLNSNHIAYYFKRNEVLHANGFPNEFAQVLVNIIQNAKDVLVERKVPAAEILFDVYAEGDDAVMTIQDNGGGVTNPIVMERMFEPFFTTKEGNKGTGIGLYMAKKIIEDHMEGQLSARLLREGDRKPGENGMIFTIKIPRYFEKGEERDSE